VSVPHDQLSAVGSAVVGKIAGEIARHETDFNARPISINCRTQARGDNRA